MKDNEKYDIIYADPPWLYNFSKTENRKIENKYNTMNLKDICNLDVPSNDNSILYLWATAPKLLEAIEVMKCWGFEYKTQMIWDKKIIGMGYWFRGQHEILLVGVKGKMKPPQDKKRISSIYSEKKTKHSKKPNYIRDMINIWFPEMKKLEMFAREKYDGWDVFGNEVKETILIKNK